MTSTLVKVTWSELAKQHYVRMGKLSAQARRRRQDS
jgi:hypothetical protein